MFYFTCNESKIYESFTFWNKLQEKMNFHDILIYWDAPVYGIIKYDYFLTLMSFQISFIFFYGTKMSF